MSSSAEHIIDRDSYTPIYIQLKEYIKNQISNKRFLPDQRIPSENELSMQHQISRMTVRQAIKELEREGLIYIRKGEGTFVKKTSNTQMLIKLDGFSTEMRKLGYRVFSRVLDATETGYHTKYETAYEGLREDRSKQIVCLKRLRFLEESPFAIETSYLHTQTGTNLLKIIHDKEFSIYRYFEEKLSINLARAEHTIEPILADKTIAELLSVQEGSPLLFIRGTTYSSKGYPVEYIEGIYKGNQYRLEIEIKR